MGDPLQRIYGFIGAIPNIMSISELEYDMVPIILETNHRFSNNPNMLKLDRNIRENSKNILKPDIKDVANIKLIEAPDQEEESLKILNTVKQVLRDNPGDKIAILVRQGINNKNTIKILKTFDGSINYFNALFSDEDEDYISFHQYALQEFIKILRIKKGRFNRSLSHKFEKKINNRYKKTSKPVYLSLLKLLESFLKLVFEEYKFLSYDEKIEFIKDTLENKALKQFMEYIESDVIIATIHGAKGLEWDYVIVGDLEKDSFPTWIGICKNCKFNGDCKISWDKVSEKFLISFHEELSVFYVASTRSKKEVIYSYSSRKITDHKTKKSCFLELEGINLIPL